MKEEEREQLKALASGEKTNLLPARWTHDCQGKQDLDCSLVFLSTRYYPDFTSYPSIYLGDLQVARGEFEGETEGEAKVKAERWAQGMFNRIIRAVARAMLDLDPEPGTFPPRGGKVIVNPDGGFLIECNCGGKIRDKPLRPGTWDCPGCGLPFQFDFLTPADE